MAKKCIFRKRATARACVRASLLEMTNNTTKTAAVAAKASVKRTRGVRRPYRRLDADTLNERTANMQRRAADLAAKTARTARMLTALNAETAHREEDAAQDATPQAV